MEIRECLDCLEQKIWPDDFDARANRRCVQCELEYLQGVGELVSVYRLFGEAGQLLYVGITGRGFRRLADHAKEKHWWPQVATARFEHHLSLAAAMAAERAAFDNEHPRYNLATPAAVLRPSLKQTLLDKLPRPSTI